MVCGAQTTRRSTRRWVWRTAAGIAAGAAVILAGRAPAVARGSTRDFGVPGTIALAQADTSSDAQAAPEPPTPVAVTREEVEAAEKIEESALPISLSASYYLLSDYIWRGINWSEYAGEGREKPVHQLTTTIEWDTADFGRIGFSMFFCWYAAQRQLNPTTGDNLQEVDYTIYWSYLVEPIATDVTLGLALYTFPNSAKSLRQDRARGNNNDDRSQEWYFTAAHDDAWMWSRLFPENEDGVLNPSMFLGQDVGIGAGAAWMEFGISHGFEIIDNLTITPGHLVAVDGGLIRRYAGMGNANTFRIAYQQFSLDVTYDLTELLHLPKWAGSLSASGLLYFNNALGTARREGSINDELYGGMSVNWGWGG